MDEMLNLEPFVGWAFVLLLTFWVGMIVGDWMAEKRIKAWCVMGDKTKACPYCSSGAHIEVGREE
jgi:hypothetical protein